MPTFKQKESQQNPSAQIKTDETFAGAERAQRELERTKGLVGQGYQAAKGNVRKGMDEAIRAAAKENAMGMSAAMGQVGSMPMGGASSAIAQNAAQNQAIASARARGQGAGQLANLSVQEGLDVSKDARDVIQSRINLQEYKNSIASLPEQERAAAMGAIDMLEALYSVHGNFSSYSRDRIKTLLETATSPAEAQLYRAELDRIERQIEQLRENAWARANSSQGAFVGKL